MPDQLDLTTVDLQDLVATVYADWNHVNPYAASYLNALDVNDCHQLDDPVGNETAEIQIRHLLSHATGWRGENGAWREGRAPTTTDRALRTTASALSARK